MFRPDDPVEGGMTPFAAEAIKFARRKKEDDPSELDDETRGNDEILAAFEDEGESPKSKRGARGKENASSSSNAGVMVMGAASTASRRKSLDARVMRDVFGSPSSPFPHPPRSRSMGGPGLRSQRLLGDGEEDEDSQPRGENEMDELETSPDHAADQLKALLSSSSQSQSLVSGSSSSSVDAARESVKVGTSKASEDAMAVEADSPTQPIPSLRDVLSSSASTLPHPPSRPATSSEISVKTGVARSLSGDDEPT